jgi:hypothetical protein
MTDRGAFPDDRSHSQTREQDLRPAPPRGAADHVADHRGIRPEAPSPIPCPVRRPCGGTACPSSSTVPFSVANSPWGPRLPPSNRRYVSLVLARVDRVTVSSNLAGLGGKGSGNIGVKRTRKRRRGEGESSFAPPFVPHAENPDRAVPMEKEKRKESLNKAASAPQGASQSLMRPESRESERPLFRASERKRARRN